METLWQDIRFGARLLVRKPGFAAIAILTLALGIGANTAIFSVLNATLLRPLPYKDADGLVLVWGTAHGAEIGTRNQISFTDMEDWRQQSHAFEGMVAYTGWSPILSGDFEAERMGGMQVSDGYFTLMKTEALLGRVLLPEEQEEGKDLVAVISYGFWQRKFGGDPGVVGKTVALNSRTYTVIGVLPKDFSSLPASLVDRPADVYRPLAEKYAEDERSSRHLRGIARLKPAVGIEQAQGELDVISREMERLHPRDDKNRGVRVVTLYEDLVGNLRTPLLVLQAAVILVLLIGCANVANLLLGQATVRRRELAVRAALGAGRSRLIRQTLTESLLLAAAGGALGFLLASWGTSLIQALGAKVIPELARVELDFRVLAFTMGFTLLTGIVFGLAPALQTSQGNLGEWLKEGARGSSGRQGRVRSLLVVSEVALALVLLTSAGLLVKSFLRLRGVDPGFDPQSVLTAEVALPYAKYPAGPRQVAFFRELMERLSRQPGVRFAAATSVLPESGGFDTTSVAIEGREVAIGELPYWDRYMVTPDYFRALGIPLRRGRLLEQSDNEQAPLVALINETTARLYWPNQDPLGQRIRVPTFGVPFEKAPWRTVVGVVGDVRQYGLDAPRSSQFYVPHAQNPAGYVTLVVRTATDPLALGPALRREVRAVDKDQPLTSIATMEEVLADSVAGRRFSMTLLGVFAAGALGLAAVGLYGVIAYSVAQRTQEIGIRMALGALPGDVLKLVIGQGMALVAIGVALGLAATLAVTRVLESLLFEVSARDPLTFALVPLGLAAVALAACYLPARRALRIDPLIALRYE